MGSGGTGSKRDTRSGKIKSAICLKNDKDKKIWYNISKKKIEIEEAEKKMMMQS